MNTLQKTEIFAPPDENIKQMLASIFDHLGYKFDLMTGPARRAAKEDVAERLSKIAHKEPAWGWRYIHGVLTGELEPRQAIAAAIKVQAALFGGAAPQAVLSHPVQVMALGDVRPGSLVYGDSRRCANPSCPVWFVPRTWNQLTCSRECGREWRKWRKAK